MVKDRKTDEELDHELDHIFDPTFNEKSLIKSAKRKSYLRMIGVSSFISIGVLLLFILLKVQLTPYFMNKKMVEKELYYEIYGANTYTGAWTENYQLIGSSAFAPKYKLLNGKPVNLGEVSLDSPTLEVYVGNSELEEFTYTGNRVMNFFHPSIEYTKYTNDLHKLNEVRDDQLIEMALSFDKAYSYQEVADMLPKDVTLQWNWINIFSKEEMNSLNESSKTDSNSFSHVFKESEVTGFPSISKVGEKIENPVQSFLITLDLALSKGGSYKEDYESIHDALVKDHDSITEDNVEIIGVVVVGDKQQLTSLIDKNYIKASSFGAIVDKY